MDAITELACGEGWGEELLFYFSNVKAWMDF